MLISLQTKLILGVVLIIAISGIAYNYKLEQQRIGREKAAAETRELINEINNSADNNDARFVACTDGGFVYDFVTNKCTERPAN